MSAPINLVPPPTPADIVRESVVATLRQTLEEAERGEIECVAIVICRPGGAWKPRVSTTDNFSGMIGRLEIAKYEWIADYLSQESGRR
jgi:hypothetical protein